ncbi:hypothetical protein [Quadrisphaera sp. DSM 44207]|uniref:hypothetical protein n=1 Tax=Quadrisphaera sp. DSM 44207 TaxID=1881057 RepID=UPI00088CB380|nr:hypothetical protein [Quadrisphaera sp. DSM 44207]SDQ07237.1 hypothetical protein SAMN05428996_0358 [Quadrisphaera sp. DSM 44207]
MRTTRNAPREETSAPVAPGAPGAPAAAAAPGGAEDVHDRLLVAIAEVERRVHLARAEVARTGAWTASDLGPHLPALMRDRSAVQQHRLFARLPHPRAPRAPAGACPACGGPSPCTAVAVLLARYGLSDPR